MYPTSTTTHKLPFEGKIRVSSTRRFILVRWMAGADTKPFIVRRSDTRSTLEKEYCRGTDFIIDQADCRVTYHFNGHEETGRTN